MSSQACLQMLTLPLYLSSVAGQHHHFCSIHCLQMLAVPPYVASVACSASSHLQQ